MCHQLLLFEKLCPPGRNALWPLCACPSFEHERDSFNFRGLQEFEDQTAAQHRRGTVGILGRFEAT